MLPIWIAADRKRIETSTLWTEQWKDQLTAPTPEQNNQGRVPGWPLPVRGILLQDCWGQQPALMQCVERKSQRYAFNIQVGGRNIANPQVTSPDTLNFRVKVYGIKHDDTLIELFTTAEINIEATADQMAPKFILAAQGVNLPVKRTDVQVGLGNPSPGSKFIPGKNQFEIDKEQDPPDVYIGAWQVVFSGPITKQFKGLTAEVAVLQPFLPQHLADLTDVTSYPTLDVLTDRIIPVHDVLDRDAEFPWKVGSKVLCVYFPDVGFGIISSTFHDMSNLNV